MSNFYAYSDAKDPAATRPFTFDWAPQLAPGVVLESVTAAMVTPAGCSFIGGATFNGTTSRVYLSGGNPGEECVFEISAATSDGPELIVFAFGVRIADAAIKPTEADEIAAEIKELKAARAQLARGERVLEVRRNGRQLTFGAVTLESLNALIQERERDLESARAQAAGRPRRRAIRLSWAN